MTGERRRLSAILAADVVGYSRLVGLDEAGTVARVRALFREVAQPEVAKAGGRVFKAVGDGFLAEFPSAVAAVTCAAAIQAATEARAAADPEDRRIRARLGVHLGDVLVEGTDLFGDGVNVAARLEGLAEPGGVVLSAPVADAVRGRVPQSLEDMGEQALKNIERPIRVFRLAVAAAPSEPPRFVVPERPSLVVLPFQNLSGDPEQEYFTDGMVEDITTALSRIRWLFVIARNSAFTYKGRAVDVRQVGRELGVRYVLEGSVRKAGSRVRITAQLIEAPTGHHVWADRFEGEAADVFELQDRVTEALAGVLEPTLRFVEGERLRRRPTESLDAYDLHLRARAILSATDRPASDEALALLRRAIALDPGFRPALGALAFAVHMRVLQGWASDEERTEALAAAAAVLESETEDPDALSLAAHAVAILGRDPARALPAVTAAISLNPNSARALAAAGWVCIAVGRPAEGAEYFQRALRLSPRDPGRRHWVSGIAAAHLVAGDYEEALELAQNTVRDSPSWPPGYRLRVAALQLAGRDAEARSAAAELLRVLPSYRIADDPLVSALRGHDAEAASRLSDAFRRAGIPD